MSNSAPPEPPPPPRPVTKTDRKTFATHVRACLAALGMSQRAFEKHVGMPHGELSKLFSGTKRITRKVLDELAPELKTTPEDLVAGTALEDVLRVPPTTPESTRITELVQQLDELRAQLAAAAARADTALAELKEVASERDTARKELADAHHRLALAKDETKRMGNTVSLFKRTADVATMAKTTADAQLRDLRAQLAQTQAAHTATHAQLVQWRDYAQALEPVAQQVRALATENEQLRALLAQAQNGGNSGNGAAGALLAGGLIGVGLAALAGANDKQPYRRR